MNQALAEMIRDLNRKFLDAVPPGHVLVAIVAAPWEETENKPNFATLQVGSGNLNELGYTLVRQAVEKWYNIGRKKEAVGIIRIG